MTDNVKRIPDRGYTWERFDVNGVTAYGQIPVPESIPDSERAFATFHVCGENRGLLKELVIDLMPSSFRVNPPRALLVGPPGYGKSAILRAVAAQVGIEPGDMFDISLKPGLRSEDIGVKAVPNTEAGPPDGQSAAMFRNILRPFGVALGRRLSEGRRVMIILEDIDCLDEHEQGILLEVLDGERRMLETDAGTMRLPRDLPIAATANHAQRLIDPLVSRLGRVITMPAPQPAMLMAVAAERLKSKELQPVLDALKMSLLKSRSDPECRPLSFRALNDVLDRVIVYMDLEPSGDAVKFAQNCLSNAMKGAEGRRERN